MDALIGNARHVAIDVNSAGDNEVLEGVPKKRLAVLCYTFLCDAIETVQWQDGAGAELTGPMTYAANGGATPSYNPRAHFITGRGEPLVMNLLTGVQVSGHATVLEID